VQWCCFLFESRFRSVKRERPKHYRDFSFAFICFSLKVAHPGMGAQEKMPALPYRYFTSWCSCRAAASFNNNHNPIDFPASLG
jgi:hypothetical protein